MRVLAIAILVTGALTLAGCGGDGDDGGQAAGTTAARADTTAAATSTTEDEVETVEDDADDATTDTAATPPAERPGPFAVRVNGLLARGDFDGAWRLLHPVQQDRFSASELASCWAQVQQFGPDTGYRVTQTRREPAAVPGGPAAAQPATTVTLDVVLTREGDGEDSETVLATFTQPVYEVDGELRWSVSEGLFEAIEDDAC